MKVLRTVKEIQEYTKALKAEGRTIGLVPTMGALHEGHLTLMRRARQENDVVIASVFVNPTQFGPNEDFDAYPRRFEADCEKMETVPVDAVFHPEPKEMYPAGYCTYVNVEGEITKKLCGAQRPGHFRGVATVVTKLMNLSRADRAYFGQKDAQQVVVVKQSDIIARRHLQAGVRVFADAAVLFQLPDGAIRRHGRDLVVVFDVQPRVFAPDRGRVAGIGGTVDAGHFPEEFRHDPRV